MDKRKKEELLEFDPLSPSVNTDSPRTNAREIRQSLSSLSAQFTFDNIEKQSEKGALPASKVVLEQNLNVIPAKNSFETDLIQESDPIDEIDQNLFKKQPITFFEPLSEANESELSIHPSGFFDISLDKQLALIDGEINAVSISAEEMSPQSRSSIRNERVPSLILNTDFSSFLRLPNVMAPELFNRIPFFDPIGEELVKYIPSLLVQRKLTGVSDVPQSEEGLHALINAQCWRATAKLAQQLIMKCERKDVELALHYWVYRIIALIKLRLFDAANTELEALGDFGKKIYQYQEHPAVFGDRHGCFVPFSLRVLWAQLPALSNNYSLAIERLSILVYECKVSQSSYSSKKQSKETWKNDLCVTFVNLFNILIKIKDYQTANAILDELLLLLDSAEDKLMIYSVMERLHLKYGNIKLAQEAIQKMECLNCDPEFFSIQLLLSKGFLAMGTSKYDEALVHFQSVLSLSPENVIAVNNVAMCYFYTRQHEEAIALLERLVLHSSSVPNETVILNLTMFYEILYANSDAKKKQILSHVTRNCGDNFDVSCLRLG